MIKLGEKLTFKRKWTIEKFNSQKDFEMGKSFEKNEIKHNCLLNEGINELFTILCSAASGTKFDNTNAYLGVGDEGTTPAAPAQTGLLAATNKFYKAMDLTYPTYGTAQKATWRSTFAALEANYAWKEFTVINGADDTHTNLNRLVSDQGTKTSGQVWQLTFEISIS